jgi:hypothetical protein
MASVARIPLGFNSLFFHGNVHCEGVVATPDDERYYERVEAVEVEQ